MHFVVKVSCLADDVQEQKCEKQHLQKQLQKALKDLRKAHSYISKLEDEVGTYEAVKNMFCFVCIIMSAMF